MKNNVFIVNLVGNNVANGNVNVGFIPDTPDKYLDKVKAFIHNRYDIVVYDFKEVDNVWYALTSKEGVDVVIKESDMIQ